MEATSHVLARDREADLATRLAAITARTTAPLDLQGFLGADEGTRTLDLLHGKDVARAD
jgi:hypothetical protein